MQLQFKWLGKRIESVDDFGLIKEALNKKNPKVQEFRSSGVHESSTTSRPIPELPPVTIATFPVILLSISVSPD